MNFQQAENTKVVLDALSVTTVLATMVAWLPPMAALVSVIWGLIRIYETKTVQGILRRRRTRTCTCNQPEIY